MSLLPHNFAMVKSEFDKQSLSDGMLISYATKDNMSRCPEKVKGYYASALLTLPQAATLHSPENPCY